MFYEFNQNNSGGSFHFDYDKGIAEYVIIEALSADIANVKAEEIGLYFNGCQEGFDCDCCGDRWSSAWEDGDEVPSLYGTPVTEGKFSVWGKKGKSVCIHYMDGHKEWF